MEYPKISIITPSYNQGAYLEETILSVLNQKYPNLEYIIIDGGSTDNSVEIIKQYEDQLSYWVSEPDKGTWEANNKGLQKVTGDYWCVVNSDDLLNENALKTIAPYLREGNHEWITGKATHIDKNSKRIGQKIPKKPNSVSGKYFLHGCWISHPTVFLSKKLIDEVGVFDDYHLLDLNYWLRLEEAGYFPHIVDEYLASLRIHYDSKSANRLKLHLEYLRVIEDFILDNNIQLTKDLRNFLQTKHNYTLKLLIGENLLNKQKYLGCINLLKLLKFSIFERWYWGSWKRLFFGVKDSDPLNNSFDGGKSKGNWN